MPRPPSRTKQLLDPMAAFQMVHVMEGVIQRGTATVLRDLNRPLFGKTGTTNGPTNVWFVGGTPDIVAGVYLGYDQPRPMGGYAQGGRIAAPIWKQWAQTALKDQPEGAVRRAARHPLGARSTARRASACSACSRPTEDPKSSVIWEAFQPQTEPRRSYRSGSGDRTTSEAAAGAAGGSRSSRSAAQSAPRASAAAGAPAARPAAAQPRRRPSGLPTQNAL